MVTTCEVQLKPYNWEPMQPWRRDPQALANTSTSGTGTVFILSLPARADFYEEKVAKLGPDPLREDADAELLWARMQKSRSPVGLILMQQDAVAGIGNIYRAEILFKVQWEGALTLPGCLLLPAPGVCMQGPARAVGRHMDHPLLLHITTAQLQEGLLGAALHG